VLRFPTISADQVVFSYAETSIPSVWPAGWPASSHPRRLRGFARFSPDGRMIAFTGEYDGNREVYLIPAEGGSPSG